MKIWAAMMVKDEADIIGYTLKYLLTQEIDGICMYDNMSMDNTKEIILRIAQQSPIPIVLHPDPEVAYFQSKKMTRLAHLAAEMGADWILPLDADELVYSEDGATVGHAIRASKNDVIHMPWWFHYSTIQDPPGVANPYLRMQFRDIDRNRLPKVTYRYNKDYLISQGNHGIEDRHGNQIWGMEETLHVRHFPHRSAEQFCRKMINGGKAYEAGGQDIPQHFGIAWRIYYEHYQKSGPDGLREWYNEHFIVNPTPDKFVEDPAPYKE